MDEIIVIDKPKGITSHDVVDMVRRHFGIKKVGHAGTLDPMATGVLVVLTGRCTKQSDTLIKDDKEYEGELTLGATSDTEDADGTIVNSDKPMDFTSDGIKKVFDSFTGEIDQVPPAYSAIKHKGKKLYQLARKGIKTEMKPRRVTIFSLGILDISIPKIRFRVVCSKGTYIRKLASDIGTSLGCGAYLSALRRTRSGQFTIGQAIKVEDLDKRQATRCA